MFTISRASSMTTYIPWSGRVFVQSLSRSSKISSDDDCAVHPSVTPAQFIVHFEMCNTWESVLSVTVGNNS